MAKKVQLNVLVTKRNHAMLKVASKAYRSPSLNWFVGEMIECMLNPSRWQEFAMRLNSGHTQQILDLGQSILQDTRRGADPVAGTRKRGEPRRRAAGKGGRRG